MRNVTVLGPVRRTDSVERILSATAYHPRTSSITLICSILPLPNITFLTAALLIPHKTLWPESASDRCLSTKLVPTIADRRCHKINVTDPYGRILGFLDQSPYFFFQLTPHLYSRGWMDPVPDPPLRKSGRVGNRTRTSGSVARNSGH
jgi:hypothetical protein